MLQIVPKHQVQKLWVISTSHSLTLLIHHSPSSIYSISVYVSYSYPSIHFHCHNYVLLRLFPISLAISLTSVFFPNISQKGPALKKSNKLFKNAFTIWTHCIILASYFLKSHNSLYCCILIQKFVYIEPTLIFHVSVHLPWYSLSPSIVLLTYQKAIIFGRP